MTNCRAWALPATGVWDWMDHSGWTHRGYILKWVQHKTSLSMGSDTRNQDKWIVERDSLPAALYLHKYSITCTEQIVSERPGLSLYTKKKPIALWENYFLSIRYQYISFQSQKRGLLQTKLEMDVPTFDYIIFHHLPHHSKACSGKVYIDTINV